MEYKDYYSVLGIGKSATVAGIKKAYRKLARKYHPDVNKNPESETKFKEVGEAYEVLKDPEKRKAYDQYGADWKTGGPQYQQSHGADFGGEEGFGGGFDFGAGYEGGGEYSDFFESFFGGGRRGKSGRSHSFSQKGEDMNASLKIPIEKAYSGTSSQISFESPVKTSDGRIEYKHVNLNVKIPKGIKPGQKIRLAGKGAPGHGGGSNGDLFITIEYEIYSRYRIDGADIYINLPVSPWEAVLGTSVVVKTPFGNPKVKIPAGSAQGKKLRLMGKGIPSKKPGDLYIVVNIVLPPADNEKAKKIYKEMSELKFNPRANEI